MLDQGGESKELKLFDRHLSPVSIIHACHACRQPCTLSLFALVHFGERPKRSNRQNKFFVVLLYFVGLFSCCPKDYCRAH